MPMRRLALAAALATSLAATFALPALAADPIKVGAVLPFSGGLELFGGQAKLGLDLAAKEINESGGILGHPVEILYEDDKTDPKSAVEATRKLIQRDDVFALVGPITSNNRDAMAPTLERAKTPLLYATNYEGGACSRYIFSFNTVPNQELAKLLPYMNKEFGDTYFMFGADYIWPQKMFETAKGIVSDLGGETLGEEFTPWGVKEFAPVVRRIADTKAKVLVFALPGGDGITFIKQAEDFGLLKDTTVAFLGFAETYLGAFGEGKGQNMFVAVPMVAGSDDPKVKAFVDKIKASGGTTVSHYVFTHYNALMAMKAAIEKAGSVDKEAMIDAMDGLVLDSPTGPVTVGPDHHVTMNMFLAKTEGEGLVTVEALGEIAPEPGCPQ